jgi:signal transduction histidine kinase/CheY-like chemotaxis protein
MRDLYTDIGLLFTEDALPTDESGALTVVLERLRSWGGFKVFIADRHGDVLGAFPEVEFPDQALVTTAAECLSRALTQVDYVETNIPEAEEDKLALIGVRAARENEPPLNLGILLKIEEHSFRPDARNREELKCLARLAGLAVQQAVQLRDERTRNRHLLAEQETLKRVHADTVAHVLQEREDRLQEKRQYITQLESEVTRRSAALREAMQRAELANRSKSEFLANMSHEIRTPMTAILGYTENLIDAEMPDAERLAALHIIRRNGQHLLDLINDILDLSKIEAGRLVPEFLKCSPCQLVADVSALMQLRADPKKLSWSTAFSGPIPETIATDPTRLRQILINLIGNAIKFTQCGSVRMIVSWPPDADFEANHHGRRPLRFEITDTGIGMTEEQLRTIFQPFTQADASTTRKFGGTGLGLSISKRLAQMLGGDLLAASRPGEGSAFTLTIDTGSIIGVRLLEAESSREFALESQPQSPPAQPPTIENRLRGGNILLAEDGPDNQRLIAFILRKAGAKVTVAENGRDALELAQRANALGKSYDIILMDMQMPVLDGYEATRLLRESGYGKPILALTAHAMEGDREKCVNAGCDDFATKPIDRHGLIEMIRGYLFPDKAGSPADGSERST